MHVISSQRRFRPWRATEGSVAVLVAVMLVLLIGFAGLGTEVTYALLQQRQMQATASAAALGGATALMTGHPGDYTVEVYAAAAAAGFANGVNGVTVTPNYLRNYTANSAAVEVIVGQPLTLPLSSLFHAGPWTVSARAVAIPGTGGDCALQTDPNAPNTTAGVTISGGAGVNLKCGLAVNATGSSAHSALTLNGGASLTASSVTVRGEESGGSICSSVIVGACNASFNATNGNKTQQLAIVGDPYLGTPVPAHSALCTQYTNNSPTLNSGTYCGLTLSGGANVTMNPGVYYINGGSFSITGGAILRGTGVTIVLTTDGSNYASATIASNTSVTLVAPTTGPTAGLVFFQDPNAPTASKNKNDFSGGSTMTLTGALYFPSEEVSYSGGTSATSPCTQLVASIINFTGNASFNSNCASVGTKAIGSSPSVLVE